MRVGRSPATIHDFLKEVAMRAGVIGLVVMMFVAESAVAGGINLTWGSGCWQDNPSTLLTFACDSNAGSASLTTSFAISHLSPYQTSTLAAKLDLQSDSALLPDWWQLRSPEGCRAGALAVTTDFSGAPGGCVHPGQTQEHIYVYWVTTALPGPYEPPSAPNRVRLKVSDFFRELYPRITLVPGIEYYAFRIIVNFTKSAGPGACQGCETPLTVVFNDLWTDSEHLTAPIANVCVRWQAGGVTPCSATPARNPTWGQVKGLYR
jgi:hypothetical protein